MKPTPDHLRKRNAHLVWYTDSEINSFISFLTSRGFVWSGKRKAFHLKKAGLLLFPDKLHKVIGDRELLEREIQYREEIKKEDERGSEDPSNIRTASLAINVLVFLMIINLFLGWIVLHFLLWILLEVVIVFLLFSLIRVRKKLLQKS